MKILVYYKRIYEIPQRLVQMSFCGRIRSIKIERGTALKNLVLRYYRVIAAMALMVTTLNVNTACFFIMHQPKLPEGAEKLRKF